MKNALLFLYSTNILVRLLTVNMKNFFTPKNLKMYDPILVTLLTMRPHYSQSSRENATPSCGASQLASYNEVPPPPTGPTPGPLTHLCTLIRAACKAFRCFSLGLVFFFYWWRNYIISICSSNQSADLFFSTVSFSNQSADFFLVAESGHSQEPIKMTGAYDYGLHPWSNPLFVGRFLQSLLHSRF